jgi:hypothetical protein
MVLTFAVLDSILFSMMRETTKATRDRRAAGVARMESVLRGEAAAREALAHVTRVKAFMAAPSTGRSSVQAPASVLAWFGGAR